MPKTKHLAALALSGLLTVSLQGLAAGADLFRSNCSSCHGEAGTGIPGLAPPLQNPDLWTSLGDQAPNYLVGVVSNGMSGKLEVDGQVYMGVIMPPQAHLDAATITAIAQYVLTEINPLTASPTQDQVTSLQGTRVSHADLRKLRNGGG